MSDDEGSKKKSKKKGEKKERKKKEKKDGPFSLLLFSCFYLVFARSLCVLTLCCAGPKRPKSSYIFYT